MSIKEKASKKEFPEIKEYHATSCGIFFKRKKLLCTKNSPYQKIEVFENEYFGRILILDGLVQTTERDEFFYHEMLVHPAFVAHPLPQNILIIGGGDGGGLKEILRYPIEQVYLVEIDPLVVEVSKKYFPWLLPSLKDKRSKLLIADGREFLKETDRKFDVVIVDSSDPVGPSLPLHEKDFFEDLKNCLNPEGVVVTQLGSPLYHLDSITKKNIFLKKLFKLVFFYLAPVPTYPGGSWCFAFLSDKVGPFAIKRNPPSGLKYFNLEIHQAAFALPAFMRSVLCKT